MGAQNGKQKDKEEYRRLSGGRVREKVMMCRCRCRFGRLYLNMRR